MPIPHCSLLQITKKLLGASLLLAAFVLQANAQTFQSGSTGADGAFNPTSSQSIAVPSSGVFNFTTVNIPSGVTVTITPNSTNTPVTMLATGDVVIGGTINISGKTANLNGNGGAGGPGGYPGGNAGYGITDLFTGNNGNGPGGGSGGSSTGSAATAGSGGSHSTSATVGTGNTNPPASTYGSGFIQPLTGGSGGGGGGAVTGVVAGGGGGGGGAIIVASSTSIAITGTIDARGGNGANGIAPGGAGSGGAIRLVSNTISGTAQFFINGGNGGDFNFGTLSGGKGGLGYLRAEAFNLTAFSPSVNPGTGISGVAALGTPNPITITNAPNIKIVSVAGINSPVTTVGSFQAPPDIVVPSNQTNPVAVVLEGRNLPANAFFTVTVTPLTGTITSATGTFTNTSTPGVLSASPSVSLPSGLSVISATAVVDLLLAEIPDMFINGEKVAKMEIKATYGGNTEITYITTSGKRIIQ